MTQVKQYMNRSNTTTNTDKLMSDQAVIPTPERFETTDTSKGTVNVADEVMRDSRTSRMRTVPSKFKDYVPGCIDAKRVWSY